MDFFKIRERSTKRGTIEVYPDFVVGKNKDLMVRGKSFYAIWDADSGLWSMDDYKVVELVDKELYAYADRLSAKSEEHISVKNLSSYNNGEWREFLNYVSRCSDNYHPMNGKLTFENSETRKTDYASKRLPYPLQEGDISNYDELMKALYDKEERDKLEWALGSIVAGDSKSIQKFIVLYGMAGAGKSTFLNIVQDLFEGYYTTFEAKELASNNNQFSAETFRSNPLIAIQHDGDLSRIEDNSKLNSIISHEEMIMNEKFKSSYTMRINCFLFMGTNKPVKITDAKSGIIRRLIDVNPSGRKIPFDRYQVLMNQIKFELGAIAWHCLQKYRKMGKAYYASYIPLEMMAKTDRIFNFVSDSYDIFAQQDSVTLKQAWEMYKQYIEESLIPYPLPRYEFREELRNYFDVFQERARVDDKSVRNIYSGFRRSKFVETPLTVTKEEESTAISLVMDQTKSLLDEELKDCPAQYGNMNETPNYKWKNVKTKLSDLDTSRLHYVQVPENLIVIDFDIKNDKGEKDAQRNLEAAAEWPSTYSEYSKGGSGVHLHYWWDGDDPGKLKNLYSENIEVKVFRGDSSLRRRLSFCNNVPIAHISSGLPLKEEKVIDFKAVQSEQGLRRLIERNLRKEIHPGTKPSVEFICKILDDAYASDLSYDVSDMRNKVLAFANNSNHWADMLVKMVPNMQFVSKDREEKVSNESDYKDERLVFFDCEVFSNLFLINWKYEGTKECVRMINPTPAEVGELMKMKLIGFNCRRYDNHILYARYIGYTNEQLYELSKKIVNGNRSGMFGEAYNLSYTDVYDFASKKQSLKKWEIELGLHHMEWALPWDQPVPEDKWVALAEYCDNDVIATEAVFHARKEDFVARKVLAKLSGLTVNDTTNSHSARIIFGKERKPQREFMYTDLATGKRYSYPLKPEWMD